MNELFAKIIKLPDLSLNPVTEVLAAELINSLHTINGTNFREACKINEKKIKHIEAISEYLDAWQEIPPLILDFNQWICATWLNETQTQLGNDQLLPLTILLLPEEHEQLTLLQKKIKFAFDFSLNDFTLTNLYQAITAKLSLPIFTEDDENDRLIFKIASVLKQEEAKQEAEKAKRLEELQKEEKLNNAKVHVEEYCKHLLSLVNEALKSVPTLLYFYGGEATNINNVIVIKEVIDRLEKKLESAGYKKILSAIEQFIVMQDIYLSIIRDNMNAIDKYAEIQAKFIHHQEKIPVLGKIMDKSYKKLSYRLFAPCNQELKFADAMGSLFNLAPAEETIFARFSALL